MAIAVAGLSKDVTEGINYGITASRVKEFLESNRVHLKHNKKSSKDIVLWSSLVIKKDDELAGLRPVNPNPMTSGHLTPFLDK